MSPMKLSENPRQSAVVIKGSGIWYLLKIVEYVLISTCMLLLAINQYLYVLVDDFTPVHDPNLSHENNTWRSKKLEYLNSSNRDENKSLVRVKRNCGVSLAQGKSTSHAHDAHDILLTDFLIMYPSCTTVIIIQTMEILGQLLKDPISKGTSLILVVLCIFLSIVIFIMSLLATLRVFSITMMLTSVFSVLFLIFKLADFILILFS